jgi:two-component system sensor histidine kinase AgrC
MMDYIRSLLSLIFAISVMYMLLDCRIKSKKSFLLLGLYIIGVLAFDIGIFVNYGYTNFMKYYPFLVHLPVLLAFIFVSSFKPIKVLFVLLTLVALSTSFSYVGLIISYFFDSSREVVNIVCYILYAPIWLLIYKYLRPNILYMLHNSDKGWLGFSIIPLSYSALIYSLGTFNLDEIEISSAITDASLLFIMTFSAYYITLKFFRQTQEHLSLQSEQNILKTQVSAAEIHLAALTEAQEKTVIYRHDTRHHLNLIGGYIARGNDKEALAYMNAVNQNTENLTVEEYCDNYAVNLILGAYIEKAKSEGIQVKCKVVITDKCSIADTDLCVIFANAIENATNACKQVSNIKDRFINISCKPKNTELYIQITNSYAGDISFLGGLPVTTKKDHGIGTKSIAAVAVKYGGIYSFEGSNKIFTMNIIL